MANEVAYAGDKHQAPAEDITISDADAAKARLTSEAGLATPKKRNSQSTCVGHEGMCHPGKGDNNAAISNDQIINFSPPEKLVHETAGIKLKEDDPAKLEPNALKNTRDLFLNPTTSPEDRVRAAQALVRNGITEVEGKDGQTYQLNSTKDGNRERISVTTVRPGQEPLVDLKGALNARGEVLEVGGAEQPKKSETAGEQPKPLEETPPFSGKAIFNPALSNEEKLLEADRMYKGGEKRFLGPDGKSYETSETQVGARKVISIFTRDESGAARPLLRGIIGKNGALVNQQDDRFKAVDYESDYAKAHGKDTALLNREAETKRRQEAEKKWQQEEAEKEKQEAARKEQEEAAKLKQQQEEAERKRKEEEERNKKPETAEEQLLKTAADKFKSESDRSAFQNDMDDFQNRARLKNLPQQEIDNTYKHVTRLLQEGSAAVPEEQRQLAAKTLMHQLAVPTVTDQGYHNTCNVTTLAERTLTRQPSIAAEIVATSAIKGSWTAPDGKEIKFKRQDLVPGSEEKYQHRISDGSRTYATQLLNLAMVNDSLQRKMPPQYYGYGSRSATNKTGETVTYADGSPVGDGGYHGISLPEISAIGKRLTGETDYIIESNEFAPILRLGNSDGLIPVSTKEELGETLKRMKAENRLPAIIMVDSNDKLFSGSGLAANQDKWHVVSVVDFDESKQQAAISNQWGPSFDIKADINDLYRSTRDNL